MESAEELQMVEVELLKSMYSENELTFGKCESSVDFMLNLNFGEDGEKVELAVQLSPNYPIAARPDVMIRCARVNETEVNRHLRRFVDGLPMGEAMLHEVISWIQGTISKYAHTVEQPKGADNGKGEDSLYRLWIFSHHLYSTTKRRDILALTKRFDLRGMSVPGKPAIIVVEGWTRSCESFWEQVRSWNWQRIFVKHEETLEAASSLGKFRELILESANGKSGDLSQLRDVLEGHGLGGYFRKMFNLC
ncbi:hypothetical protein QR680_013416 [Steinernema hermaphroditum]|uniref:RWD domain-containing protein n=1 Tax=Steinernema hermaphroditum TaxID=289476 RepID=A0AA39I887_9BILA|nr:hypothetical protein QR680_013416 [Steinernema hermaphroditum]